MGGSPTVFSSPMETEAHPAEFHLPVWLLMAYLKIKIHTDNQEYAKDVSTLHYELSAILNENYFQLQRVTGIDENHLHCLKTKTQGNTDLR